MRWTRTLIPTLRDIPKDAEATSHQLLLKAGFIRKLSSGVYSYLPLGLNVIHRICRVIRERMNATGASEILLPALHPADLWRATGRYDSLGEDKISFKNRSGQEFVLGPTHEEVITELAAAYFKSYQQLPVILYQIQTKFRDEIRPRFGIIRTKEFMMKDAYSFDVDQAGLDRSYETMYAAYGDIFKRIGLKVDVVPADPGVMGGDVSHEFMARSAYGEGVIAVCDKCDNVTSRDVADRFFTVPKPPKPDGKSETFETPNLRTIEELKSRFKIKPEQMVKTILYQVDEQMVAVCVRGDHEVNEAKLRRKLKAKEVRLLRPDEIMSVSGAPVGFAGPVGLKKARIVVDPDVVLVANAITGANEKDKHLRNVAYGRDFKADQVDDIRYVVDGDRCLKCKDKLKLVAAMELGHVFKLGTRYSKSLGAKFKNKSGEEECVIMGCYGLGVNRILAAVVEEHHDKKGIRWPSSVAPFLVHIITVNHAQAETRKVGDEVYKDLTAAGLSCLYDDREERAGVKFNDADLIGIPYHVIVSERHISKEQVEVKIRQKQKSEIVGLKALKSWLQKQSPS